MALIVQLQACIVHTRQVNCLHQHTCQPLPWQAYPKVPHGITQLLKPHVLPVVPTTIATSAATAAGMITQGRGPALTAATSSSTCAARWVSCAQPGSTTSAAVAIRATTAATCKETCPRQHTAIQALRWDRSHWRTGCNHCCHHAQTRVLKETAVTVKQRRASQQLKHAW
jgi:hypothetical protein